MNEENNHKVANVIVVSVFLVLTWMIPPMLLAFVVSPAAVALLFLPPVLPAIIIAIGLYKNNKFIIDFIETITQ